MDNAESKIRRFITHVALYCQNVATSKQWYQDVLGMSVVAESEGKFCALSFGEKHHDIALAKAPNDTGRTVYGNVGLYHISIDVGSYEDSLRIYQKAQAKNSEFVKIVNHRLGRGVYVRDPDGNVIEMWSEAYPSYKEAIASIETFSPSFEDNPIGYYLDIDEEISKLKAGGTKEEPQAE